jgi:hypothetical protein
MSRDAVRIASLREAVRAGDRQVRRILHVLAAVGHPDGELRCFCFGWENSDHVHSDICVAARRELLALKRPGGRPKWQEAAEIAGTAAGDFAARGDDGAAVAFAEVAHTCATEHVFDLALDHESFLSHLATRYGFELDAERALFRGLADALEKP